MTRPLRSLPIEPRVAFLQPGQTMPRDARDAIHSFNVSTTALALLGALQDAGYGDLHFFDVACEEGERLSDWNDALFYRGVERAGVEAWLGRTAPDVVLLTAMFTCDHPVIDALIGWVRAALPDALIVLGGRQASLLPHWYLGDDRIDLLVQGEGEQTIVRILDALTGRQPGVDVFALPGVLTRDSADTRSPKAWPEARLGGSFAWDLVLFRPDGGFRYQEIVIPDSPKDHLYKSGAPALHSAPLLPTRGCPLACRFCGSHFTPEMRPVGTDRLFGDVVALYRKGIRIFYNISENFCLDPADRALVDKLAGFRDEVGGDFVLTHPNSTFLPIYLKGKEPDVAFIETLKRAGTSLVTISLETFSPRFDDKKLFKKYSIEQVEALWRHLRSVGVGVHLYMMTGFPDQSRDELLSDVRQIRAWIDRGLIDAASWSNLLYLPGTPYYNEAIARGRFTEADFRRKIDAGFNFFSVSPEFNFTQIPTDELQRWVLELRAGRYDFAGG